MNKSELTHILNEASSLNSLEKTLQKEGIFSGTFDQYIDYLSSLQMNLNQNELTGIDDPSYTEELPSVQVNIGPKQYNIHGIVHGAFNSVAPGWKPRKQLRKQVAEATNHLSNECMSEDYWYEENLQKIFDFRPDGEIKDVTRYTRNTRSDKLSLLFRVPSLVKYQVHYFSAYILLSKSKPYTPEHTKLVLQQKALHDIKYQHSCNNWLKNYKLPEPINLELSYIKEAEKLNQLKQVFNLPNLKRSSERSKFTADNLNDISESGYKIINYIGGMHHMSEISYFLKNPDYCFENLKTYVEERTTSP